MSLDFIRGKRAFEWMCSWIPSTAKARAPGCPQPHPTFTPSPRPGSPTPSPWVHRSGVLPSRTRWDTPLVSSLERGSPQPLGAAPLPRRGLLPKAGSTIRVKSEAFNQQLPEYFPDLIHVFLQTIQITVDQLQTTKGKRRALSQLIHTPLCSRKGSAAKLHSA